MTVDEEFETADTEPRWNKREALHNKAIAYSFILILYAIVAAVIANATGYGQYYFHILLAGFVPYVLLLGPLILYTTVIKPHRVGKYVLENKRLPDDM